MKNLLFNFVAIGLMGLGTLAGNSLSAQSKGSFKLAGPCLSCGEERIMGIVKSIDGVKTASFDANSGLLSVSFDGAAASITDIQLELSLQGYDAGEFTRDAKAVLPPCAMAMRGELVSDDLPEPGIDDIEGLDADEDWELVDDIELASDDFDLLEEDEEDIDLLNWASDTEGDDFGAADDDDDDE
jgi:hypothetical protein